MSEPTTRVCLWSGPRCLSTALMYAFARRADTRVIDEPLHAHFLRVSSADHPGRDRTLAAQDPVGERVVRDVVLGPCDRPVSFQKHMAHHLLGLERKFLTRTQNVLLIRDPKHVLPALAKRVRDPSLLVASLLLQVRVFEELRAVGREPVVLDAARLAARPAPVLRGLCDRLGLAFHPEMLRWPKGGIAQEGPWAVHWNHGAHRSTGFRPLRPVRRAFPRDLRPLLAACTPWYEHLREFAISGPNAPEPLPLAA